MKDNLVEVDNLLLTKLLKEKKLIEINGHIVEELYNPLGENFYASVQGKGTISKIDMKDTK